MDLKKKGEGNARQNKKKMAREEKTCRKEDEIRRERKITKMTRNGGYGCGRNRYCRHRRNRGSRYG